MTTRDSNVTSPSKENHRNSEMTAQLLVRKRKVLAKEQTRTLAPVN